MKFIQSKALLKIPFIIDKHAYERKFAFTLLPALTQVGSRVLSLIGQRCGWDERSECMSLSCCQPLTIQGRRPRYKINCLFFYLQFYRCSWSVHVRDCSVHPLHVISNSYCVNSKPLHRFVDCSWFVVLHL